jgi:hypothetical protein
LCRARLCVLWPDAPATRPAGAQLWGTLPPSHHWRFSPVCFSRLISFVSYFYFVSFHCSFHFIPVSLLCRLISFYLYVISFVGSVLTVQGNADVQGTLSLQATTIAPLLVATGTVTASGPLQVTIDSSVGGAGNVTFPGLGGEAGFDFDFDF